MHKYTALSAGQEKLKVSIVGARGYSGVELARLLLNHPQADLQFCYATQKFQLSDSILDDKARSVTCLADSEIDFSKTDVVFLATPPEVSLKLAPRALALGKKVIDLSGAFRLNVSDYQKWYKFEHTEKEYLHQAQYGLVPFCEPKPANLISNPGCYATAVQMALIPLLKKNLISSEHLVIDAKSGTSGAGKKAAENLIFSEVSGECLPYKVGKHQHMPEIIENVSRLCQVSIDPHFSTHLLPVDRGIIAGIYAECRTDDVNEIKAAYDEAFDSYPLVRHEAGMGSLLKLKNVVGTAYTHLSYELVGKKLYVYSSIDNLMKGAASQAVENFNRQWDLPIATGLKGGSGS